MKTVLCVVAMVFLLAGVAFANPFLVCDPQTGVQYYKVTGAPFISSPVTAQTNGSLRVDVGTAPVGTTNVTVAACATDGSWGEVCSTAVPFALVRPTAPVTPGGLKLIP